MYVSIHMSPQSRGEAEDAPGLAALVEQALEADAAGIAAICLTEHHLAGFNTYSDPFLLGAYLAGRLEQAYVAIHIVQLPLHHPARIVEQANLLDQLARGRLMVGLAPGSVREIELDVFGVGLAARSAITQRRIEQILAAWGWSEGQPPLELPLEDGGGAIAARIHPSSYRRPHPLIGRATMTDATIVETAERGWPVIFGLRSDIDSDRRQVALYRDALERAGHDGDTLRDCLDWLGYMSMICVAPTEREAQSMLDEYVAVGGAGPIVTARDQGLVRAASGAVAEEWKTRQLHKAQVAVAGTPQMIIEHLLAYEALGLEHLRVSFVETPGRYEQSRDSLQLFLSDVLPALAPQPLPGPARTASSEIGAPS